MKEINKYIKKVKRGIVKLLKIISKQEMRILPGQIAFFLILSIFPLITILGLLMSLFAISFDSILNFAREILPLQVVNIHPQKQNFRV